MSYVQIASNMNVANLKCMKIINEVEKEGEILHDQFFVYRTKPGSGYSCACEHSNGEGNSQYRTSMFLVFSL